MFGRKNHAKILKDEFITNIRELEQTLAQSKANKIRNEFQVRHYQAEVELNIAAIAHAETRLDAYKAGRDAAEASQPAQKPSMFGLLGRVQKPIKVSTMDYGSHIPDGQTS